jgi:RimJ/RimL family protein N-acetyltransferase
MLRPDFPIRTKRLLLRPLESGDVDAVHAYQSRADVCRYIPYSPRTRDEVAARLAPDRVTGVLHDAGQALLLAVVLADSGLLVGDVMLAWTSREHRAGEIGYVLNPSHHGHGYVTEAARALLQLGFGDLGLHRIVARVDARNEASAAVLRRLGMRQEAHLVQNEWFKGEWTDELDFALLAVEWRQALARGDVEQYRQSH